MATVRRVEMANVLHGLIWSLDTTLKHPTIQPTFVEIGSVYLNVSKMKLTHLLATSDPEIEILVSDPLLAECSRRAKAIANLVGQENWQDVLRESHALLGQLPGEPPSEPIILPPPPEEDDEVSHR